MTDNRKEERSVQQILSNELDSQLKKDPPQLPTLEEFRAMAWERLEEEEKKATSEETAYRTKVSASKKKRSGNLRKVGIVAGFIAAVLIGAFALTSITDDVGADKNPKEEIITEDGVIIEDGGYGSSEGKDNVFIINEWQYIEDAKHVTSNLLVPRYIPQGYKFKILTIEKVVGDDITAEYIFDGAGGNRIELEISIINGGETSSTISDVTSVIESEYGKIYIQGAEKKATTYRGDGITISMWSSLSDEEIKKVFDSLGN